MKNDSDNITRRSFMGGILRLGALAGMLGGAGWLIGRNVSKSDSDNSTCINEELPCRRCRVFESCGLPRAEVLKRIKE